MLRCAYTFCSYGQIPASCTIPSGSPCPPSRIQFYTPFMPISCIRLFYDWSLSPHNLHLLFCCVLSILALIWLVLTVLFCAAIRRDSVSLWRFPYYYLFSFESFSHQRYQIIIIIIEFFTPGLADGFSLEFEWQQVSSSLQDSSQSSGRPQQCCSLDTLHPSANFQVLQAL